MSDDDTIAAHADEVIAMSRQDQLRLAAMLLDEGREALAHAVVSLALTRWHVAPAGEPGGAA